MKVSLFTTALLRNTRSARVGVRVRGAAIRAPTARAGLLHVVMSAGRFAGSYWKEDPNALLQPVAHLDLVAQREEDFW